jgi:hypothetical protein
MKSDQTQITGNESEAVHIRGGLTYSDAALDRVGFLEWEPGNGRSYRVVLTKLSELSPYARARIGARNCETLLVSWENPTDGVPRCAFLAKGVSWYYLWSLWHPESQRDVFEVARAIETTGWDLGTAHADAPASVSLTAAQNVLMEVGGLLCSALDQAPRPEHPPTMDEIAGWISRLRQLPIKGLAAAMDVVADPSQYGEWRRLLCRVQWMTRMIDAIGPVVRIMKLLSEERPS